MTQRMNLPSYQILYLAIIFFVFPEPPMITSDADFYRLCNLELNLAFMAAYTTYKFLWLSMIKPQILVLDLCVFYTARLELFFIPRVEMLNIT